MFFEGQKGRPANLFGHKTAGNFYDYSKDSIMGRLDKGIPHINRALGRHQVFDTTTNKDIVTNSVINGQRVMEAKTG